MGVLGDADMITPGVCLPEWDLVSVAVVPSGLESAVAKDSSAIHGMRGGWEFHPE